VEVGDTRSDTFADHQNHHQPDDRTGDQMRHRLALLEGIARIDAHAAVDGDAASARASAAAGTRPAMNRPPIEMLATNPRMIMLMHGGIVSAMTAAPASTPLLRLDPDGCAARRA
jgi:hypothetical protein